jgi:dihydroneopterin aldolase/D-erythro-7,8-dihydroneopterin triphosphate epimerase
MDIIHIRDLTLRTFVGIYPEEKEKKQDVILNIDMYTNLTSACKSDRIEDTVDYKAIKLEIIKKVESSTFNLIEHLASTVADICLANKEVLKTVVTVDKPGALRFARSVAVTIERDKDA